MSETRKAPNPFQIGIAKNDAMGCFDLQLNIGGMKDKAEAEAFADVLSEWLIEGSAIAWKKRVQ